MEGISSEAASLAGHLKLSNLCWIYDQNHISIEGDTELAFTEDVAARFAAYGWNVQHVSDANDTEALSEALSVFEAAKERPTLIIVRSHIGYGAPNKQDTAAAHGEALGETDLRAPSAPMAGRRIRRSWCRTECASMSPAPWASVAAGCMRNGTRWSTATGASRRS